MDNYCVYLHTCPNGKVQAGHAVGVAPANIRKVCDGQRRFAGGFRWKWSENK